MSARRPLRVVEIDLETPGDRFRALDVPEYGDPETIPVSALAVGDFVVEYRAQQGIRGKRISSAVVAVETNWDRWTLSTGYRRKRLPVESRKIRFASREITGIDVPADHEIVVRRPIREGES